MVDVFATWCGPCKELDAKVFSTPEGEKALAGFVALKVDAEAGAGPAFVERHRVVGYPTVLFLDADGNEIDRVFGELPAAEFFQTARDYLPGKGTLAESERRFAHERAGDFELALEILLRHASRSDEAAARDWLALLEDARAGLAGAPEPKSAGARALRRRSAERLDELVAHGRYAFAKYVLVRGTKQYAAARAALEELRRTFPASPWSKAALYELAQASLELGDVLATRRALDEYLATHGSDADAAAAYAWFCFKHGFQTARGVEVAAKALQKEPARDDVWDTLADLYFARGEKQKALEANAKAIALKPSEGYYQEQRRKYER
jgi:thioredoxin-like negative regulator of GroEL